MTAAAELAGRLDAGRLPPLERPTVLRLAEHDGEDWDLWLAPGRPPRLERADGARPDASISADAATWRRLADDVRGGMAAFRSGRLRVRGNLSLGVAFLIATGELRGAGAPRFATVRTPTAPLAVVEAGQGPAVVLIHGLGATKISFLPTLDALADDHRVVAIDLPGFGDSGKPIGSYDAAYLARAVIELLDALGLDRAHFVGNSLGGRVALELGLRAPDRVDRLALLAPSLAWLRDRPWARWLRLVRPELGLIQPAPRAVVEPIVRRMIPGGRDGWVAAGVDEFLRGYLTPRGRAAFYAAARSIYLEEPHGPDGFWTRLRDLQPPALFVWGRQDTLVPLRFARHVERVLPAAEQLELDCGHVPQLERPRDVHAALRRFLAG